VTGPIDLKAAGTSQAGIEAHYDLSDDFFRIWLGDDLVYSCALWDMADPDDTLQQAQRRKLDFFADRLGVKGARVLDVGCGWGAFLERCIRGHGATAGVGLTLSPAQVAFAARREVPADYRLGSWVDHEPAEPYDVITCIESTEHFATDVLSEDEKVAVYRDFFARAASWLTEGGRVGLQLICLDGVGHEGSRPGRGPLSELIRTRIFPESMPSSLSEMALGWETHFRLAAFLDHPDHYRRTFRHWSLAYRGDADRARELVGEDLARTFERYFAAGEVCFRQREHSLYRVVLQRRPQPKSWAVPVWPSLLSATVDAATAVSGPDAPGASAAAVRSHYDISNDFYALWLGPSMMYSSGMWSGDAAGLEQALAAKIDYFAAATGLAGTGNVLDVGCGWGYNLRRLVGEHGVTAATGLTLSQAQRDFVAADPVPGVEIRVESWADHEPRAPYDGITSFGAFEHFARDGTTGTDRIGGYRQFFARCYEWLRPGGRMGLETIAHDDAPDTAALLGRGPLGDFVLDIYPESIPPHLSEVVLGFEPWFEVEVLRSDAADFARTARQWLMRLRANEVAATELVGAGTTRRFSRYLAASEVQFRTGAITNYRLVLHRRQVRRR
jgi:cyclopropane-fatty-acyl-phospholipid synthase